VTRTNIDDAVGLTVADVVHKRFTALPADSTVAEVRAWFAASSHRRMAFLADDGRYVGSLTPDQLAADLEPAGAASALARYGPTVAPDAPAGAGEKHALVTDARRVPVVDRDGRLLGVVSVTADRTGFCGTS
jgi:CBS domain-containing protein